MSEAELLEAAARTAAMAESVATALSVAASDAAARFSSGDLEGGIRRADELLPRIERFLAFAVVARDLVRGRRPDLAQRIEAFVQRLLGAAERLGGALEAQDLVAVAMTLELAIAPATAGWGALAEEVSWALAQAADGRDSMAA